MESLSISPSLLFGIIPYTKDDVVDAMLASVLMILVSVVIVSLNYGLDYREEDLLPSVAKLETQILAVSALLPKTRSGGWRWCVKKACISYGV